MRGCGTILVPGFGCGAHNAASSGVAETKNIEILGVALAAHSRTITHLASTDIILTVLAVDQLQSSVIDVRKVPVLTFSAGLLVVARTAPRECVVTEKVNDI